jgi:hypothetical protein
MRRSLLAVAVAVLTLSIAGNAAAAEEPAPTAESACALIGEGSVSGSVEACVQGFNDAKAGKSVEASCDTIGSGAVVGPENVNDCQAGWFTADVAGKGTATTPISEATTACELIGEGSVSGSVEACAEGYSAAKAGKFEAASCDSIGAAAVVGPENVKDCQAGWSAADAAGKGTATTPSPEATAACELIGEGSVSGSVEACGEGFTAAKSGKSEEATCDSIGAAAVVGPENVKDCEEGWSAG